jgi:hypothetical protein
VIWNEVLLDHTCHGNRCGRIWISADNKYIKKGSFVEGEWREVIYANNKCKRSL